MKLLERLALSEVLAEWVTAESSSDRFSAVVSEAVAGGATTPEEVLTITRGWPDRDLFEGFPRDVEWWSASVTRDELLEVQYSNWEYWLEVSGGTRLPSDAIVRMGWGASPGLVPHQVDRLILVTKSLTDRLVVLEGHARLTNFVIAEAALPQEVPCIIGLSHTITTWGNY